MLNRMVWNSNLNDANGWVRGNYKTILLHKNGGWLGLDQAFMSLAEAQEAVYNLLTQANMSACVNNEWPEWLDDLNHDVFGDVPCEMERKEFANSFLSMW